MEDGVSRDLGSSGPEVDVSYDGLLDYDRGDFASIVADNNLFVLDEVSLDNLMEASSYSRLHTLVSTDYEKPSYYVYGSFMGCNGVILEVLPARMTYTQPRGKSDAYMGKNFFRDRIIVDGCLRVVSVEEVPHNGPPINMGPPEFFGALDHFRQNMMPNLACKMYQKLDEWVKKKSDYMKN